jgi:hypothetical protein
MDHVDRVASRVSTGALAGFVGGVAYGTFKGLPVGPTALKVAASFAIVGTALFVPERAAYVAFASQTNNERGLILTSHAFAGVFGGGLNGYFYQKKPLRGMFYFVPMMMAIGFLELGWEEKKKQRIQSLLVDSEQTEDINESQN